MLEIIILIIVAYVSYNIGIAVMSWRLRDIIIKEAKKEGIIVDNEYNILTKEIIPSVSKLRVEQVHGIFYLYDTENTFICQANTLEELANLALKYKNIKYASVINGNDVFAFVDGTVKTANEVLK
jgi:sulfur relay (sulfurtransferase) DsrF/TusC family protein